MEVTRWIRLVAISTALIWALATNNGIVAAQESGGAAALSRLRERSTEKALEALGAATDLRVSLPEAETDDALSAAAGGMFRALAQEDAETRFGLLAKWTLPNGDRKSVRLLSAIVPQDAPPQAFARVIGERPRDSTFAVADVNGVRGLFSSGWLLVTTAEECGRLKRLTSDLEPLVAQKVSGADTLLLLAQIAETRAAIEAIKPKLTARAEALKAAVPVDGKYPGFIDSNAVVIAAAALKHPELRVSSERMLDFLVESTLGGSSPRLRPFLRLAQATAIQLNRGDSGLEVLRQTRLKYWIPVSGATSATSAAGAVPTIWLTHEDHVLHLAGAGQDGLLFRYPLSGDFNFLCETQEGGNIGTDGGLAYGGLYFEALGSSNAMTVRDADAAFQLQRPCPFVRHESRPVFNRVSIRNRSATDGNVSASQFLANLHPMWTDELFSTSPWLGLRGMGENRPAFRNLKLTGSPVIPREVKLTDGQQLRGWLAGFYGETQASFHAGGLLSLPTGTISSRRSATQPAQNVTPTVVDSDWQIANGVVSAPKRAAQVGRTSQSVLRYHRPLLEGESVSYEFEYQPGEIEVHPALGRLALLIESGGVRIHWLTDGDREWSGLLEDNTTIEPLNRRSGRDIPLKQGEWNKAILSRADGKLKLTLNGTLIYERAIDFRGDLQFGLYRDRSKHAVKVRNVILTGDWPKAVPEDFLRNPVVANDELTTAAHKRVQNATLGESIVASNASAVRTAAARLSPAERYDFLSKWVLPSTDHSGFRMSGAFTPVAPPRNTLRSVLLKEKSDIKPVKSDGVKQSNESNTDASELVSPVFDLIETASGLGKLDALKVTVEAIAETDDAQHGRDRAALLALINLELADHAAAEKATERLLALLPKSVPADLSEMWPETLLTWRALTRFGASEAVGELISVISKQRTWRASPPGIEFWHTHIANLQSRRDYMIKGGANKQFDGPVELGDWINSERHRARSNGVGSGEARWHVTGDREVQHVSGHQSDYLLYRSPLSGNFEVTCEIGGDGGIDFLAGGSYIGMEGSPAVLSVGSYRLGGMHLRQETLPLLTSDPMNFCRVSFRDGELTVSLNGRVVRRETLPEHAEPWLGLHAWYRSRTRMRNFRITGSPVVRDEVVLSADPQLSSWLPYHDYSAGSDSDHWSHQKDTESSGIISGKRHSSMAGMGAESLLTYMRPLVEDGVIAYEFFYEPGKYEMHPAFDRLAFLLRPQGIKLHWITDDRYDTTEVSPLNEFAAPGGTVVPVPLQSGQWNKLRLITRGSTVSVEVNGQMVGSVDFSSLGTHRHGVFGLFHFAGDSEVRVRNVVMRGEWPKSVPPIQEQQLAVPAPVELVEGSSKLKDEFVHDFQKAGLPDELFKVSDVSLERIKLDTDGVHVAQSATGTGTVTEITSRCSLTGDFDVEVTFAELKLESSRQDSGLLVLATIEAPQRPIYGVNRLLEETGRHLTTTSVSFLQSNGGRSWQAETKSCYSESGRLRLSRRGNKLFYLFAEDEANEFRVLHTETVGTGRVARDGISLRTICNSVGSCHVVWNKLVLRAERIAWLSANDDAREMFTYLDQNSDGRLSLDEYATRGNVLKSHRRDFILSDRDGDGFLSLSEYTPFAHGFDGHVRGPLPDPMVDALNEIIMQLDKQLDDWDQQLDREESLERAAGALAEKFSNLIPLPLVRRADSDRNGKLSRQEFRTLLEAQMGILSFDGLPLRKPNGQVNNFSFFIHVDANRNNQIEKAEFLSRAGRGESSESVFAAGDKDANEILTLDEWLAQSWTWFDPISEFRRMDTNLDGFVDTDELVKVTPTWKMPGTVHLVKIYDANNDGKMSLDEYRLTPHHNMILVWQKTQRDVDNDAKLSFAEFTVDHPWFQVARWFYFHKFDQNQDGFLDLKEYDFATQADPSKKPRQIYVMNADGRGLKKLNMGSLLGISIGSPAVSPDGKSIAFDAAINGYTVMLMPIEGGEPRKLGHGTQPTWSPDGKQYACRRFIPMSGSWICDLQGGNETFLLDGWGTQWSPDGKTVFSTSDFQAAKLVAYDLATETASTILNRNETPFRSFDLNGSWSPDSRRICLIGTKPNEDQALVIIDLTAQEGQKVRIRYEEKGIRSDIAWHPSGRKIVFSKTCPERKHWQLYELDPDGLDAPQLLPRQVEDSDAFDVTWTPDGQQLVFVAGDY